MEIMAQSMNQSKPNITSSNVKFKGNLLGQLPKEIEAYQKVLTEVFNQEGMNKLPNDVFMSVVTDYPIIKSINMKSLNGIDKLEMKTINASGAEVVVKQKLASLIESPTKLIDMLSQIFGKIVL